MPAAHLIAPPDAPPPNRERRQQEQALYAPKEVPPRIRTALEAMVLEGLPRKEAAQRIGVTDRTLRTHLLRAPVLQYYNRLLQLLRDSERATNLHAAIKIRDDRQEVGKTKLLACRYLDGETAAKAGTIINVGVGVNIQPGYICDVSSHRDRATQILQQSGSVKNALEDQ